MCNADGLFCLNRGLRRFSQMGYDAPRPFFPGFWVPASAGMTEGVLSEPRITQMGYDGPRCFVGFHPHPRFKSGAGSSPLPSMERGRRALFFSGFPPARERRSVLGLKEQQIRRSFSVGVGFG